MRTIAEKPKAPQQTKSASCSKPSRALSRQSHDMHLMCLQRTIGNQAVQRLLKANIEELEAGSDVTSSTRFVHDFSQIPLYAKARGKIQPKLAVGTPEDIYERDANRIAEQVNARAFTIGNDIIFGAAQYMPNSKATQSLLAHELTHVVQQSQLGSTSYGKIPSIQRQSDGSDEAGTQRGGAGAQGAQLRREYIEVACGVIADIQAAVEGGRTWYFENEFLLQGEEWLRVNQQTLVDERREALQELIRGLDAIIQELDSGALAPSDPATRSALADLWEARNPRATQALARRWSPVFAHRRLPSGALEAQYPALSSYIVTQAGSPPGMLQAASFPTWWVLGCHRIQQPEQPLPPGERVTPAELGLPQDSVVYLSGLNNDQWDWEPRGGPYPVALGRTYDWHYDPSAGRVFIVVDAQQLNLLRDGRVEIQR
jgi:hypothetical protein